jgi:hypothetical protein
LKGKTIRKGPPKQKFRTDIIKVLDDLKELENGVFEGYIENHIGTYTKWSLGTSFCKSIDITSQHQFDAPRVKRCGKHHEQVS